MSDAWIALTVVHLAATAAMVGLMLTIHFVHYPSFALVDPARYAEFQALHMRRISQVLVVPWGLESVTAAALVVTAPTAGLRVLALVGAALSVTALALTAFRAAPAHGRLLDGFDDGLHRALMRTDLTRTVVWITRLVVAGAILWASVT